MELLTGLGLATAAGLNAYIPLLALGLLSRFTGLIDLPHGYAWLENSWVLTIVAVLLVVEIVADKIPALDSVNDAIQTFVRPTSGGIVFGSGTAAQTPAVTDPGAFAQFAFKAILFKSIRRGRVQYPAVSAGWINALTAPAESTTPRRNTIDET